MYPHGYDMIEIARRTKLVLLLAFCCEVLAGPDGAAEKLSLVEQHLNVPYNRMAYSASQRLPKLIPGYRADDEWTSPYVPSERRESLRVASLPILFLPIALSEQSETNVIPNRRKPVDYFEENEKYPCQDHRDEWKTKPAYFHIESSNRENPYKKRPQKPVVRDPIAPSYFQTSDLPLAPNIVSNVPSGKLVEMFRAQTPKAVDVPPIIQSEFDASDRIILPDNEDEEDSYIEQVPKRHLKSPNFLAKRQNTTSRLPNLTKALKVRAVLTVPLAGYSESYTAWWNPVNGDSRIHFQGGSTITFRKMLPNGLVQKVEMRVDRTEGRVVRCGVTTTVPSVTDRAHPALPNLQLFSFSGYEFTETDQIERWHYNVSSPGDARGETINTYHELLLTRDDDDFIRPVRYYVSANSTVLGPDSDVYDHFYFEARTHKRESKFFEPNIDEVCDQVEQLSASSADDIARLEPLREFTMLEPNPRYTAILERFKRKHERVYADEVENVVRKNILTQTSRYVSSGNRAGATFEMGLNFLADRLDAEMVQVTGVEPGAADAAEKFPHTRPALTEREPQLPNAFDWRTMGGVSPVRFQGTSCASCWAFAVAGAVEGALFRRTQRLVPLSEQTLVDCAGPFGGNGCKGTWPSHAYDYIKYQGLPALEEYTPYKGHVEQCKADTTPPITRISAHVNVTKYNVPALQVAIKENGPAVVIVDSSAKSFQLYKKGVLYDEQCSKNSAKHAMLAVGWGQKKGEPYFILKNSWSEAWGERGYVRVQARANTCGVLTHPSYPRLEDDDVLLEAQ